MTLLQLLTAMAGNSKVAISIIDSAGSLLINFNAAGFATLDDALTVRVVKTVTVTGATAVEVTIDD